jgi:hypothetical protein
MTTATKPKVDVNADKANIHTAISSIKKSMTDFKSERKAEWKSFKTKFNDDMERVEKSFKKMTTTHKK